MKRFMFVLLLIGLWGFALSSPPSYAGLPTVQVMETTASGDQIVVFDAADENEVSGDPDDAITGNRGTSGVTSLTGENPIGATDRHLMDLWMIQFLLDLISM